MSEKIWLRSFETTYSSLDIFRIGRGDYGVGSNVKTLSWKRKVIRNGSKEQSFLVSEAGRPPMSRDSKHTREA